MTTRFFNVFAPSRNTRSAGELDDRMLQDIGLSRADVMTKNGRIVLRKAMERQIW